MTETRSTRCGANRGLRWVGDPVDVVTGVLADASADFTLPLAAGEESGLVWRRYYSTARTSPGPLGYGHTHEHDRTLRAVVDGWLYTRPDGETVLFPFAGHGVAVEREGHVLRPLARGFELEASDGVRFEFPAVTPGAEGRPTQLSHGTWSIELQYDAHGRLVRVADAAATRVLTLEYADGRVTKIWLERHPARPEGRPLALMRYEYSAAGDLLAAIDRYGHAQRFTYDTARRMATRVDRAGYQFEYTYDAQGRCVISRGHDGGGEVRLRYLPEALATEVTRADGGTWLYRYDASLSINEIIDPYGGVRRFEYDDAGRLACEIDAGGNERRPVYGATGEIVAWRTAAGGVRPAESPAGPLPHRVPQTPCELELGDLSREILDGAPVASLGIEPPMAGGASIFSPLFPERDARIEEACRRDELGLLAEERGPGVSPRKWAYTPNGWVRGYTDHDGGRYEFEFAGGNMRIAARDPLGREIRYAYTPTDQIAAVVDPAGNRHTYHYDLRDALTEVHHCGALVERYEHDRAGNLVAKRDAQGELLVAYEYGADGMMSLRKLARGAGEEVEEHRYAYTPDGRFARIEWSGHALEFAYGGLGRRRADLRDGRGVEHRFVGERLVETTVLGRFTTRYRRIDVKTVELVDPLGNTHRLVLERDGVVVRHLSCGAREVVHYDSRGRCLGKHLFAAEPRAGVWRRRFSYSAEGDLLAVSDSERGETRYTYDAAHQLANVTCPDGRVESYRYDEAANLVAAPHLRDVAVGPGNLLARANGGTLRYDRRNNVSVWEREGRTLRFHRDALDQLRAIEGLDAPWTAAYDPLGRRTRKTFGAAWTEYYWDTDRLAAELHSDGRVRVFVYTDDFALTPWLMIDYDSLDATNGQLHTLVTDQRGAPVAALDATGQRVWSAELEPYGLARVSNGVEITHRLAGQFYDVESGLCYNRFRYYSPELGRYLEEDPAGTGGGVNLYAYTWCPLAEFDSRGLHTCTTCDGEHETGAHSTKKSATPNGAQQERSKGTQGRKQVEQMLQEGSLKIEGSEKYQNAVKQDLYKIANTKTGSDTLNTIRKSGKPTTIKDWEPGEVGNGCLPKSKSAYPPPDGDGKGTPSTVFYNPHEPGRSPGSPSDAGLNHELGHAASNAVGDNQKHSPSPEPGYPNAEEHKNTTTVDNPYRNERGLPERHDYQDFP